MKRSSLVGLGPLALALVATPAAAGVDPLEPRHEETRELMAVVEDAAALVAERGVEAACGEFRRESSRWRQDDHYVFVLTPAGETLCHPVRPNLEGQVLLELRDPKGRPIVAGFLRELEDSEDGWVHYQWPRPGGTVFYWKTTYVRRATDPGGRELIVGSGRYQMPLERFLVVDQVEDAIALIRSEGKERAFATFLDKAGGLLFASAYVFVIDAGGILRVNNAFPENVGRDVRELADIDGKRFVREMMRVSPGDSAWVHYKWPKPGDQRPSAKSSYVRRVEIDGEEWVVGAGVYFAPEPAVRVLGPVSDPAEID